MNQKIRIADQRSGKASISKKSGHGTVNTAISGIKSGKVEIDLKYTAGITPQQGFVHAGRGWAVMDSYLI
ncbi:hypothetical protein [Desulfobotulus alkaliphilus]|uniref:hypothetical protein n=1 Tax=Desulfobotulus alkaliphilus TaxID=622671 RepID=UPI0011A6D011|nr:hypothetical protein [Desulfobotulus alkaliphilus]